MMRSREVKPTNLVLILVFLMNHESGGQRNYVYDDGRIMTNYRNRFVIDIDLSSGGFNLLALRLESKDAGRYECRDDVLEGQGASAELTVLESELICESDNDPGGVVGPTQCDKVAAPNEVQLYCRVTYNGKTAPQMVWRKSGDSSTSTKADCVTKDNRVTCNTTLKTNFQLSGSVYHCELTTQRYNCSLEIRNTSYVFGGNATVNIAMDEEVKCSANSSQSCSYKWKWFSGSDSLTVSTDQTLKPTRVGSHRCEATCPVGNTSCVVDVMFAEVYSTEATTGQNLWIILPLLMVPILIITVIVVLYWRHKRAKKRSLSSLVVKVNSKVGENSPTIDRAEEERIVYQMDEILQDKTSKKSKRLLEAVSHLKKYGLIGACRVEKGITFFFHCKNLTQHKRFQKLMTTNEIQRNIKMIYNEVIPTSKVEVTWNDAEFKEAESKLQDAGETQFLLSAGRRGSADSTSMPTITGQDMVDTLTINQHFIDRGTSGAIYGPFRWKDKKCVVKQRPFSPDQLTNETKEEIARLIKIVKELDHPHLVKVFEVWFPSPALYILMEYAEGKSLDKILRPRDAVYSLPSFSVEIVENWASQIADGMRYLHEKNLVHRNLKAAHVLVMESPDVFPNTLKIGSYTLTKEHDHYSTVMSLKGTMAWMSPEYIRGEPFSKMSDVWSYGVTVWEILTRDVPYKEVRKETDLVRAAINKTLKLKIPDAYPEPLQDLLTKCWNYEVNERPSFTKICDYLRSKIKYEESCVQ